MQQEDKTKPEKDTIIVNTREHNWERKEISFQEVVTLAFGAYNDNPQVVYTVGYSRGEPPKHEGTLIKGQSVKVKKGMVFDVTVTDKS
jgi:hypothetical protein